MLKTSKIQIRMLKPVKIYIKSPTLQNGLKVIDECQWWENN